MKLAAFIENLLLEGKVTIEGQLILFEKDDLDASAKLLADYYQEDVLEMPGIAPAFVATAAIWAARYFYQAVQLTVIRDTNEKIIKEKLISFDGSINPASIYSIDLTFRYLPSLFDLAKGLAPADILVTTLLETAKDWPFSSVGIKISDLSNTRNILHHDSLVRAYVDRIIVHKDLARAADPVIAGYVWEALGDQTSLWPEFKPISKILNDGNN